MKKILMTLFLAAVMLASSVGIAKAESILFPYVANTDANLDTLISVINTAPAAVTQLHYRYWMKTAATVSNAACAEFDFFRATSTNDIVTFAVGRNTVVGGGNAMFNDPSVNANYAAIGVGAPNLGHNFGSGYYGYLLVTSAAAGADVSAGANNTLLDGEAALYDIATGAMWGYRSVPTNADGAAAGAAATINSYVVHLASSVVVAAVTPANPRVVVYPPNQFTQRLYVTPVGIVGTANADLNMALDPGVINRIAPTQIEYAVGLRGMFDRDENTVSGGSRVFTRCAGRLLLSDLVGAAILGTGTPAGVLSTQGGWAYVDSTATAAAGSTSTIYDLKYGAVTGASTGMINDGKIMLNWAHR